MQSGIDGPVRPRLLAGAGPGFRAPALLGLARGCADALVSFVAFAIGYLAAGHAARSGWLDAAAPDAGRFASLAGLFTIVAIAIFWRRGLYRPGASPLNLRELEAAVHAIILAAAFFFAILFLIGPVGEPRIAATGAVVLAAALIPLERRIAAALAARRSRRALGVRRVLIYGAGETGRLVMKQLVHAPQGGREVVGFIDDLVPAGTIVSCRLKQTSEARFEAPVLGRSDALEPLLPRHRIDELIVAATAAAPDRVERVVRVCRGRGVEVGYVPDFGIERPDRLRVDEGSAIPVLRVASARPGPIGAVVKRGFDVVAATLLAVASAPLWLLVAALIRMDSPGPVFFAQERVGQNGRRFRILKFRTLRRESNPYAPTPTGEEDPRITRVGRVLRLTGLDELPQLVNVLRGEMSLVGPRPEMPFIVERYAPHQRERLRARPGITGLWQLSADRDAAIHENIEYDLYYLYHQSLLLDLLILAETVVFTCGLVVDRLRGARSEPIRSGAGGSPAPAELADFPGAVGSPASAELVEIPGAAPPEAPGYLLVVLDQRRGDAIPPSWEAYLPAVYALSSRWSVKVVVAARNVAIFDSLVHEPARRLGEPRHFEYAPYRSGVELRALTARAQVVLTDLPHVERWARQHNIDLISVRNRAIGSRIHSGAGDALVRELHDWLAVDQQA